MSGLARSHVAPISPVEYTCIPKKEPARGYLASVSWLKSLDDNLGLINRTVISRLDLDSDLFSAISVSMQLHLALTKAWPLLFVLGTRSSRRFTSMFPPQV
ncbi:hypothetical protein RSOLAG1IB_07120 [Rhizoctonia solani AG-1 IB]|uniref:Uncharacterized protein n=1 Tax=Thanatephorus cucumeris (strain AG1-IB / isolate 7/3/14) TaxID=1108050 RepID=A0A0B7FE80_THACB|nr:hypothetical protein RSOLAG1IB_07120 [Rhizoctonia solani AG-1 IB]